MRRVGILAGACALAGGLGTAATARGAEVVARVHGPVFAVAAQGDATVLVRRPDGRQVVVERVAPDGTRSVLLRLPRVARLESGGYPLAVGLAASPAAVVVSAGPADDGFPEVGTARSVTYVLPTGGSPRLVASCPQAVGAPAVAAAGDVVGYAAGGCLADADDPRSARSASIAVAEPAAGGAAVGRWDLGALRVTGLALTGAGGLASVQDDRGEDEDRGAVRRLEAGGAVVPVAGTGFRPRVLGLLADGRGLLQQGDDPGEDLAARCRRELTLVSAGRAASLDLGTCLSELDAGEYLSSPEALPADLAAFGPDDAPAAAVAGARIATIQDGPFGYGGGELVSVEADGGDRRLLEAAGNRPPLLVGGGPGRAVWTRTGCDARTEVVVDATTAAPTTQAAPSCSLQVRTRRAALRGGRIAVVVRCARGCAGVIADRDAKHVRSARGFALGPGRHRLAVRVSRCAIRAGRVRLRVEVVGVGGGAIDRTVRLRTRPG